ncbi:hypothetical protein NDU88_004778 [Pleurodeles waltl]|uniref:Uncharacterized protein n=1 Tax=Pleurodeles waltl TaxID=8319 RepID=A0AAV7L2E1_PLEWA|nr:hypothetical protein NDU88_004778 [Pleurodeles waltl]
MPGTTGSHCAGELDACCSCTVRGAQARAGRWRRAIQGRSALTAQRDEPLLGRRRDSLSAASMSCCPAPTAPAPTPGWPTAAPRGLRSRPRVPASDVPGPVGGSKSIKANAVLRHPRSLQKQGGAGHAK